METADDILEEIGEWHEYAVTRLGEPTETSAGRPATPEHGCWPVLRP